MEIERKFLVKDIPADLSAYPCHIIEQGYLCTDPVVRIRRQDDDYILTYKGSGLLCREEYNLPLKAASYAHLKEKTDGHIIAKKRYVIPLENHLKIELDIFEPPFAPLVLAEVEFPDTETANAFSPLSWFGEDVTMDGRYHNSYLSRMKF
ncbi:MAG: CYTH domain-containing protein [Marvinbryantia sp.]|jgi:adenylate cyclase